MDIIACIYKITNKKTGKIYIGSTSNFYKRKMEHINNLKSGNDHSRYLQNSWNKYGGDSFEFEIIEKCNPIKNILLSKEQYYLDLLLKANENNHLFFKLGMNTCRLSNSKLGTKMSNKQKRKLSKVHKGKKRGPLTEETKLKISIAQKGRKLSKEKIEKRQKTRMKNGGYVFSEDSLKKMAESMRKAHLKNPKLKEASKNRMIGNKYALGVKLTPEQLLKKYKAHTKYKISQINNDGVVIKIWNSAREVGEYYNCTAQSIRSCCIGVKKRIKGFSWKYIK